MKLPVFFGKLHESVLAPWQTLMSVVPSAELTPESEYQEGNPVMQAFLGFLACQMAAHPVEVVGSD